MAPKKSDRRLSEGGGSRLFSFAQSAVRQGVFRRGHDSPAKSADDSQDPSSSDDETLTISTVSSDDTQGQGGAVLRREDQNRDRDQHGSSRPDTNLAFWTTARGKQLEGRVMVALRAVVEEKLAEAQPTTVQRVVDEVLPELESIVAEVMDREEEEEWIRCG